MRHSHTRNTRLAPVRALGTVLALAMILAAASPADAQFRVRGGVDLTNFFGDGVEDTERQNNLGFGAAFSIVNIGPVSISPEVWYRQKGAGDIQEFNQRVIEEGSAEIGLDYVEVPVMLRVDLPSFAGGKITPYLNGGPAFGWRFDCSISVDAEAGSTTRMCDDLSGENLEETLEDYELGAAFGGGFDFAVLGGIGAINLDARVTQGLSRINEDADGALEVKNRVFSIMLGYSFGLPGGGGGGMGPVGLD